MVSTVYEREISEATTLLLVRPLFNCTLFSDLLKETHLTSVQFWAGAVSFLLLWFKSDRISDQTLVVPGVQHSFTGVVVHHGVVAVLIGELNVGVPCTPSFEVVSKVDGCGPCIIAVDKVDHTAGDKSIPHVVHSFYM